MTGPKVRFKTTSAASSRNRLVQYSAGQFVFREGDLGAEMFVVRSGRVEVIGRSTGGGEEGGRVVAVLEKGDFFGEMSVLEGLPRSASIRAQTDVDLVRIDGTTFTQLLRSQPEIAVRIMRKLSRRLREAESDGRSSETAAAAASSGAGEGPAVVGATARLVHLESGTDFSFPGVEPILVGRRDPITGIEPQVDLSSVDPERSSSRQHAKILRDGDRFTVVEDIGTTNGTYLNGERLAAGVPVEIRSGDEVRFGSVSLLFEG